MTEPGSAAAARAARVQDRDTFWSDKPDGTLYAFGRPWGDGPIPVSTPADADRLLDRLVAAAVEQEVGEVMVLHAGPDETFVVWVSAESPPRVGLQYQDPAHDVATWSLNGSGDSDGEVEVRYLDEWEVVDPQIFLDQVTARRAVAQFVRDRTLTDTVDWS